ncbi:MAG: glycosyltransferase family 4 protein [Candidatus Hydrogenedentes bacterium]|nr:glycosyltransferase family 4 protein [Candidatus Hydrogenedentota bacterium]
MTLRIAMVGACPFPAPQGSQVFLQNTAECLQARGHEVHLVVYGYGLGEAGDTLRVHRARRVPFAGKTAAGPSFAKPFQDLTLAFKLRRVILDHHIQVICAHNYEALLAALTVRKRPILYFAHNAMADELPHFFKDLPGACSFGRALDRFFPVRADKVIAPHNRLAGHLVVRGCLQEQITIIAPPVDERILKIVPAQSEAKPPVMYTGNLDAYQNLDLLLNAMHLVRRKKPETKLLIGTAEKEELPGTEMTFIPDFDALQYFLAQDAVFAAPRVSWSGYPIKMLNAMAAGKAIVACESAAYPIEHEKTGLIVPDNDVEAYGAALLRLIEDTNLRAELGKRARQVIHERHHPEIVGEQLAQIIVDAYDPYNTGIAG